jgi:uncharacterized protein (DUF2236 family)
MLLGGGRSLVLQVGHPIVAAGVAKFSNFEQAPWKRLVGTLDLYMRVVYGGREETREEAGQRLRDMHKGIKGEHPDGTPWHSLDPAHFHWVHATLVDGIVEMTKRFNRPLTTLELELLYEEMCAVGELYGLREQDMPDDWASFQEYFRDMVENELHDSDTLQNVMASIFRPAKPPVPQLPDRVWSLAQRPGGELVKLVTVGSLPPVLRERFGLHWSREREMALRAQQRAVKAVFPRLPDRLRLMPPALAARRGETQLAPEPAPAPA